VRCRAQAEARPGLGDADAGYTCEQHSLLNVAYSLYKMFNHQTVHAKELFHRLSVAMETRPVR